MRTCLSVLAVACGLALTPAARAADDFRSGPPAGKVLPGPFHPYNVTGARADKYHCLVCAQGLDPAVLVFAREPSEPGQPLADLLKKLDEVVARNAAARLAGFAVFLQDATGEERVRLVQQLQDLAKALELKQVPLALDAAAGPDGYAVHADADVTVLLYHKHKVLANFAFAKDKPMTAKDVEAILAAVNQKLLPEKKAPPRRGRPAAPKAN